MSKLITIIFLILFKHHFVWWWILSVLQYFHPICTIIAQNWFIPLFTKFMPSQADHLHKISYACSNTSQFYLSYNLHLRARHVSLFLHLPCSTAFFMIRLNATQWGSIFALFAAFLFSTKAIFIKQAYALSPLVDATVLMALRMASALPFFLLICWLNRHHSRNISTRNWLLLIFAGLMGYYFSSWLDFLGLMFISASLERIILFLYPTLTVLASSVMYR